MNSRALQPGSDHTRAPCSPRLSSGVTLGEGIAGTATSWLVGNALADAGSARTLNASRSGRFSRRARSSPARGRAQPFAGHVLAHDLVEHALRRARLLERERGERRLHQLEVLLERHLLGL